VVSTPHLLPDGCVAFHKFIERRAFDVGAGFIPARSSIRACLRAGINPAPTKKKFNQTKKRHMMFWQLLSGHYLVVIL
jgi:hypothetical protein